MKTKVAVIGVDPLNDFGDPNGSLYVKNGEEIVIPANKLMGFASKMDWLVVLVQEAHPPDTIHFKDWPVHGVEGTWGAEFLSELVIPDHTLRAKKGQGKNSHGYDPFEGTFPSGIGLEFILRASKVVAIVFWGLATDFCVKAGVITACELGFKVFVAIDACRAVNANPGDEEKAIEEMKASGATIVTTEEVLKWNI